MKKPNYIVHKGILYNTDYFNFDTNDYEQNKKGRIIFCLQGREIREQSDARKAKDFTKSSWTRRCLELFDVWMR